MSELKPRQWAEGEEAAWLADKVCILGDYGKDAARLLSKQADELKQLRAHNAELERQLAEANEHIEELEDDTVVPFGKYRAVKERAEEAEAFIREKQAGAKVEGMSDIKRSVLGGYFRSERDPNYIAAQEIAKLIDRMIAAELRNAKEV